MSLRPDQIEAFFKAVNERTPPAPLSRPISGDQTRYVMEQLPSAFESIGMKTVSDQALRAALISDTYLYTLRERARMPVLHTTLVRLFTDAAGVGQHKLRLWNPFCGAGAESYSLAAMARLAYNATGAHISGIEVIGTDVLPGAIKYAEAAVYEYRRAEWREYVEKLTALCGPEAVGDEPELPISTKHLPPGVDPFFTVVRTEGGYAITPGPTLTQITKFRFVNPLRLSELGQLGSFDAVLCLSPTPIGDTPQAKQFRTALAYAVRPGGYLILRETTEPMFDLTGPGKDFELLEPGLFWRQR